MVQPRAQAGMSSLWTSLWRPWRGGAGEGAEKFKGERTHAREVSGYPGQDLCGLQAEKLRLQAWLGTLTTRRTGIEPKDFLYFLNFSLGGSWLTYLCSTDSWVPSRPLSQNLGGERQRSGKQSLSQGQSAAMITRTTDPSSSNVVNAHLT